MALPDTPQLCAYCKEKPLVPPRRRYCRDECAMAARRERSRPRPEPRARRTELAVEIALLLVTNIALAWLVGIVTYFATNTFLWAVMGTIVLIAVGLVCKRHGGRFFPRSRWKTFSIGAITALWLGGTGAYELMQPPESTCTRRSAADQGAMPDPRTHIKWQTVYECPTRGNGYVFKEPNFNSEWIAKMFGERRIWVVCWMRLPGSGIWYYTEGDDSLSEQYKQAFYAWGYLPHRSIDARVQPDPAVPACHAPMP